MSLVHRLIVGHFDLYTAFTRVPLKSLDEVRTHAMLGQIGKRVSSTEYEVEGELLYFADGYCDCPLWSPRRNRTSEEFAHTLAELEGCFILDSGLRVPLYPKHAAYPDLQPITEADSERYLAEGNLATLRIASLHAAITAEPWVEEFCLTLSHHEDFHVRGNSLSAFALMARREVNLSRHVLEPRIRAALLDPHPYPARQANFAAKQLDSRLCWLVLDHDNGQPEVTVRSNSSNWVKCPHCNWTFAAYDPRAYRGGMCMQCRQRLRIIGRSE